MKFNYSNFEKPTEGAGFLANSRDEGSRPDSLTTIDPVSLKAIQDAPGPFDPVAVPTITMASLDEAIQNIRTSQPTLIVSHEDYDQIVSAGLPAKVHSSILVDPGQAYVFRSAA